MHDKKKSEEIQQCLLLSGMFIWVLTCWRQCALQVATAAQSCRSHDEAATKVRKQVTNSNVVIRFIFFYNIWCRFENRFLPCVLVGFQSWYDSWGWEQRRFYSGSKDEHYNSDLSPILELIWITHSCKWRSKQIRRWKRKGVVCDQRGVEDSQCKLRMMKFGSETSKEIVGMIGDQRKSAFLTLFNCQFCDILSLYMIGLFSIIDIEHLLKVV